MAVVHGIAALEAALGRLFFVIGVFDGLHRGHDYLLDELRKAAADRDAQPAVITFDHHPDEVLTGKAPPLLCDPIERLERLQAAGVGVTVVQTFDVALRETPYDAFIGRITDRVELAGFLMTPDSAFGYQRAGTPQTVAALGRELGFEVVVVPPFTLDGQPVSSSAIRSAIEGGDLKRAERLLGRPYSVVGEATAGSDGMRLTFALPVALPPPGTYRMLVEEVVSEPSAGNEPGGFAAERHGTVGARSIEIAGAWAPLSASRAPLPASGAPPSASGAPLSASRLRATFATP